MVLITLGSLAAAVAIVTMRAAGDGFGERVESLKDDAVPVSPETADRELLLAASREFATRFNTYDESMLDDEGHLPDYAAVEELMTPKFGGVFADNVGYAEETVQLGVASVGTVYAVGVASQDDDSAEVLVAGTVELSYPVPDREQGGDGGGTDDPEGEDERISTGPQRFRYQLSLVKVDGTWLVDDVDDIDDGLPPFSQPSIPETEPGQTPSAPPSTSPSEPTTEPTTEPTGEVDQ